MGKEMKHMNINHRALPVFSDRSITATQVASMPAKTDKKKAAKKEGTIRLIFLDSVTNSAVADVVMTTIAAEQLVAGINKSLEKISNELKNTKMPAQEVPVKTQQTYIG